MQNILELFALNGAPITFPEFQVTSVDDNPVPYTDGNVTIEADGTVTGQIDIPVGSEHGESFSIVISRVSDGVAFPAVDINTTSFGVSVPTIVAEDDIFVGVQGEQFAGDVSLNDVSDNALTYSLVSGPTAPAILTLNPDGSFILDDNGAPTVTFVYEVTDGVQTEQATVTVNFPAQEPALADVVVSTEADLEAEMRAIADGTSDHRIVGVDTSLSGDVDLSGLSFPPGTVVRGIGDFGSEIVPTDVETSDGITTIYVAKNTASVVLSGDWNLEDVSDLTVCLFEARDDKQTTPNHGFWKLDGAVNLTLDRIFAVPGDVAGYPSNGSTKTRYLSAASNVTNLLAIRCSSQFLADGLLKIGGNSTFKVKSCIQEHVGADNWGVQSSFVGSIDFEDVYAARHVDRSPGAHADGFQLNRGSRVNSGKFTRFVAMRGVWNNTTATESGFQAIRMTGAAVAKNITADNCLLANGHRQGLGFKSGQSGNAAINNTLIQGDYKEAQESNAPYPRIEGISAGVPVATDRNVVTLKGAGSNFGQNPNGLGIVMSGGNDPEGPDFANILEHYKGVPTETSSLWDIRPKVGSVVHPDHADPVGSVDFWGRLLNRNPETLLSEAGWPVASLFVASFDPENEFGSSFTGSYGANGENIQPQP